MIGQIQGNNRDMAKSNTSFIKGQSGNPNGRPPKGYSISELAREMLATEPDLKKRLVTKVFDLALEGNIPAIKMIWSYMDGTPNNVEPFVEKELPIPMLDILSDNYKFDHKEELMAYCDKLAIQNPELLPELYATFVDPKGYEDGYEGKAV